MARNKGTFNFSANLEPKVQAPLDARTVVNTVAELTQAATWQDANNDVWLFNGLVVSVAQTGELYMLTNKAAYTSAASWKRIDAGEAEGKGVITLGNISKYLDSPVGTDVSEVFGDYTLAELFGQEAAGKIVRFAVYDELEDGVMGYQPVLFAEEYDTMGLGYRVLIKSGPRNMPPDVYFHELFFSEEDGVKKLTKNTKLRLLTDEQWTEVSDKVLLEDFSAVWELTTASTPAEIKEAMPASLWKLFDGWNFELSQIKSIWVDTSGDVGVCPVSVVCTDEMGDNFPVTISKLVGDKLYVLKLEGEPGVGYSSTAGKVVSNSVITVGESDLYPIGPLNTLTTGEYSSLDDIVGSPTDLVAAINAGKVVVVGGSTFTQVMPANASASNNTVSIDWVSGNMAFSYTLTFSGTAWTGLTDNSKETLHKGEAVESVTSGSDAVEVGGTAAKPTVGLKLDGTGNVKLTQAASGLKAEYKPIATQLAELVKDGDQVLHVETTGQQDPAKLAVTIGLDYNSGSKKISLTGVNDAVIAEIDAADFIKDGMVQSVALQGNNLVITFNTDAGAEPISVDLSKFLDVYTAGNGITISGKSIAVKPYMGLVADSNGVAVNINSGDKYLGFNAGALVSKGIDEAIETAVSQALTWIDVGE